MWEISSLPSRTEFSVRRILTYALAALFAALLWTTLLAPTASAVDAVRSGNTITYDDNTYSGPASGKTVADLGLADGTTVYTFVEPAPTRTGTTPTVQRKINIIYFAPSVDSSVATSAKYKTYVYEGPNKFTNPSTPVDITVTQSAAAANPGTSSCTIGSGIDWLICGPTKWIAKGMDSIFSILSGFLSVRPVSTDQETALFRAWTYMRSFANVAFVIAFLIIIYSQITSVGITNYSIKKLLPRLVIAAILVNVSYYICAAAVDASNILGYSIQDLFIQLRNGLVGTEGNSWDLMNFESITGFILSGGTAVTAGTIGLFTTLSFYGLSGSVFLLLPVLVTGLVAVLTALVVMAGRQAVITILIILAPIAFVAYLLPNTEKWFDKWRTIFMTMLVLFPAFSVVFGGSQLAAAAIIQNADSINQVILAMAVQVIPLLITPLLIKLSGTLLGRIAGMINNPNKGIIDRTRNWSKDRADNVRATRMAKSGADTLGKRNFMLRNGQKLDRKRREREGDRKNNEAIADNLFNDTAAGQRLYNAQHATETDKKGIEERLSRDLSRTIQSDTGMLKHEMEVRVLTDESSFEKGKIDQIHEELRAGKVTQYGAALNALAGRSEAATLDLAVSAMATQRAKNTQHVQFAKALISDEALQGAAGGIEDNGANAALATAIDTMRNDYNKSISEGRAINKHFNLSGKQRQMHALGEDFEATDSEGRQRIFKTTDIFTREAAIEDQISGQGTVEEATEIISRSGTTLKDFKTSISAAMVASNFGGKTIWGGGKTYDDAAQGRIIGQEGIKKVAAEAIAKGKISASDLAKADFYGVQVIANLMDDLPASRALITDPALQADFDINVIKLAAIARETLTGDEKVNVKTVSSKHILKLARQDDPGFTP